MNKYLVGFLFWKLWIHGVFAASMEDEGGSGNNGLLSSAQIVLLTVGVSCTLIFVVVGCTWAWWVRLWRSVTCKDNDLVTTDRVFSQRGSRGSISNSAVYTIDTAHRYGPNDDSPVTFHRQPGVHDGSRPTYSTTTTFDLRSVKVPGIVSSGNETNTFASDWFDPKYKNFPRADLEYLQLVGQGWFGDIVEAHAKNIVPFPPKILVSVKQLSSDASEDEQIRFLNESRMYRDAKCGNILKLLGQSLETLPYILIMQHMPLGDLKTYLLANEARSYELFSQGNLIRMATDIASGLEWMNNSGFVHGDLAARNCLVTNAAGNVVIGDYGLGTQKYKDDYHWSGSIAIPIRWAAPETIRSTPTEIETFKPTHKSNIWTFGVVLWEILELGKLPYFELTDSDVFNRVIESKTYYLEPPMMQYADSEIKTSIHNMLKTHCWHIHPEARRSIGDIKQFLLTVFVEQNNW